jgi:hypothetical protein
MTCITQKVLVTKMEKNPLYFIVVVWAHKVTLTPRPFLSIVHLYLISNHS